MNHSRLSRTTKERALPPCDLVLKGGITSGVVYPRAISRLARKYQIRGLGGTSAGALAAAFAAAAEYRRQRSSSFRGFVYLEEMVKDLATRVEGRTKLEWLFQPQSGTKLPFRLLRFLISGSRIQKLGAFLGFPLAFTSVAVWTGMFLFDGLFQNSSGQANRTGLAVFSALAVLMFAGILAKLVARMLADFCGQNYGLCRGFDKGEEQSDKLQLTDWIHRGLQETAGLPETEPLTFAHLEGLDEFLEASGSPVAGKGLGEEERIRLRLVTTCLTHSRPYTLPFQEDKFYFKAEDFLELFPTSVVRWMIENGRAESVEVQDRNGASFRVYPLPENGHLPVVVAVRMSLSMPIIISAIKLYCRDRAHPDNQPEEVIFTDGGIVSNFPIHFFDDFVPRHPSFGLNLIFAKRELFSVFGKPLSELCPVLADMAKCMLEHWDRRPGLAGFLEGIYDTARGWKDTTQLRLPGYRDRVQDIYLDPRSEGGVHLSMTPEQIEALALKGEEAVEQLMSKFAPQNGKPSASWKNHVWTRFRITMYLLSEKLENLRGMLVEPEFQELLLSAANDSPGCHFANGDSGSRDWKGDWRDTGEAYSCESHRQGLAQATVATMELVKFLESWDSSVFRKSKLPSPLPIMQMAKEV